MNFGAFRLRFCVSNPHVREILEAQLVFQPRKGGGEVFGCGFGHLGNMTRSNRND